jgi:hypothetical protein
MEEGEKITYDERRPKKDTSTGKKDTQATFIPLILCKH